MRSEFEVGLHLVEARAKGTIEALELLPSGNALVAVLEDVGGMTLTEHASYRRLPVPEFLAIAVQVADALSGIHRAGVIHKDIKPQNIIINRDTGEVRITDFGVSTRLASEDPEIISPSRIEGTLAYMAPEQTGRMNRPVDFRSDLYAFGVACFQLLTGELPFKAKDPMELVHQHIASRPPRVDSIAPRVPAQLADIVDKLLSKAAMDRYQSARGMGIDLRRCLETYDPTAVEDAIPRFDLAVGDHPDRFGLAPGLYGRDAEVAKLLEAASRVGPGSRQVLFVTGYSGVGKSRLIHEVKRPLVADRGTFIEGKIDQHQRGEPYTAFVAALREMVRQLLTEPDEAIARWRSELQAALGDNGAIVTTLVPDLELVVGKQPPVQELSAAEARNRFQEVFADLLRALAQPSHPLVLFLDDLQWADTPSLGLLRHLLTDPDLGNLLFIGAYRDNEVPSDHPLAVMIDGLADGGVDMGRLHIEGLGPDPVTELITDSLQTSAERAAALGRLVHRKTAGNPFFVGQFLQALDRDGLLQLDAQGLWTWDLNEIQARDFTDNVVELMSEGIASLAPDCARALQFASCIGHRFRLRPLASVLAVDVRGTEALLWQAARAGFIAPLDDSYRIVQSLPDGAELDADVDPTYRFVHDRVQQAAHELLPERDRAAVHLSLARALLDGRLPDKLGDAVFEIAAHYNVAAALVTDQAERRKAAHIDLIAGRKAKRSAAFKPAVEVLSAGRELLGDQLWSDTEGRSFDLVYELAEVLYLAGDHGAAEPLFNELLAHATTPLDQARIHNLKLVLYGNIGRYGDAIDSAVAALACIGERFPAKPGKGALTVELVRTLLLLRGRSVDSLDDLPELSDPNIIVAVEVLNNLSGPAYFHDADLFSVLALRLLNLNLRHGNSPISAYCYGLYGMIAGFVLGNYALGQEFSELAARMSDRYDNVDLKAKVALIRGGLIHHWRNPVRDNYEILKTGYEQGRVSGDMLYTGYCTTALLYAMIVAGEPLDDVYRESSRYFEFLKRTKDADAAQTFIVEQRMVLHLQGKTVATDSFGDERFSEEALVQHLESIRMKIPLSLYRIVKLRALFLFGHWAEALVNADKAAEVADASFGLAFSIEYDHYRALNILHHAQRMPGGERRRRLRQARSSIKKVAKWAVNSPANAAQKHSLLLAEAARLRGREAEALRHYDQAIAAAREHRFPQDEAVSCELAGRFHDAHGRQRMARSYLRDAVYAYSRWGATAKVTQLEAEFPELGHGTESVTMSTSRLLSSTDSSSTGAHLLDLHTVVKATQAMSAEIELRQLLQTLMRIVVENAGAERGLLLLTADGGPLVIQAEGPDPAGEFEVLQARTVDPVADLPASLVAYVERRGTSQVLRDARNDTVYADDPYVTARGLQSALCAPVKRAGELVGVLYLENNLQTGAFTTDRLETIGLLTSQIAISIDNARLYQQQKEMASAFSRFVPTEFLQLLGQDSLLSVSLGDAVERDITVVFSDIRAFTSLSEQMSPEESFAFLNSYLSGVGPVIRNHRGFIDKYIGDAVMALFPEDPADALHAAIAMQRFVREFNEQRLVEGRPEIRIGVGLHHGRVMLGTIGEDKRLEGTVISDAVNIASRLEGLTKS